MTRLVFFAALFAASVGSAGAPAPTARHSLLDKPAPDFALTSLNGQPFSLSGDRGKVVLLNFWATWCAPCQNEMPVFAAWQRQYGAQGFAVIGISMDDDAQPARQLSDRLRVNYPIAMGDEHLGARYGGVLGLPLTFLIDRRGIIRARFQGETDLQTIESRLKKLLAQH